MELIADELELDAEGLAADASRYVGGLYRPKARGMGGSQLGDFGDVITFLLNRSSGSEIVRLIRDLDDEKQAAVTRARIVPWRR